VKRTKSEVRITGLKSDASFRTLSLPPVLVAALREHRTRQLEERLRIGPAWTDLDLVFPSAVGTPLNGTNVTHRFQRQLADAGLPRMTFHDLRHGAATLALGQGATLQEIKEFLGHSQIAITADIYAHVAPEAKREMAQRMQRVVSGS
jgi:integrase